MYHTLVTLALYACIGLVESAKFDGSNESKLLRWADFKDDDMEVLCDRVAVMVQYMGDADNTSSADNDTAYLGQFKCLAPAVLLDDDRVVTSLNPFRTAIEASNTSKVGGETNPTVVFLEDRKFSNGSADVEYKLLHQDILCGRQVILKDVNETYWVGTQREYSPAHDLMVFRMTKKVNWSRADFPYSDFSNFTEDVFVPAGPIRTALAQPGDILGSNVTFCSMGFRDESETKKYAHMHSSIYEEDDHVIEDCDEWIPREWGHFICIDNLHKNYALGSGAMLFYKNKLFGVGGSMLTKGKKSVFLFTDVRPYYEQIMAACTIENQMIHLHVCHEGHKFRG